MKVTEEKEALLRGQGTFPERIQKGDDMYTRVQVHESRVAIYAKWLESTMDIVGWKVIWKDNGKFHSKSWDSNLSGYTRSWEQANELFDNIALNKL